MIVRDLVASFGAALLHSLWIGGLIAAWTAVSLRALRHTAPLARYRLAAGALASIALLPLILFLAAVTAAPWMAWLALLWLAGASASVIRVANSWRLVQRLRRSANSVDETWRARFAESVSAMGITSHVALESSPLIDVPCSVGARRPAVIVPEGLFERITPSMFHALCAHELAHVKRHDYAWNLAQVVVEALLFYHPAAWWISGAIRRERELCCDQLAGAVCSPVQLARALAAIERDRATRKATSDAAPVKGSLLERVRDLVAQPGQIAPASAMAHTLAPIMITGLGIALALSLMVATGVVPPAVSSSWTAWAAAIGLGVAVGLRHAFEPDHVIAVATLVTRERSARSAMRLGVSWGVGHTLSLFGLSTLLVLAKQAMPQQAVTGLEAAVAIMVMALGVRALYQAWWYGRNGAPQLHAHGHTRHVHAMSGAHVHIGPWTLARGPLTVGLLHGLAGSGALTALAVATLPTFPAQLMFILVFGLGSTAGMAALSGLAGWPLARFVRTGSAMAALSSATGVAAIVFGIWWGYPLIVHAQDIQLQPVDVPNDVSHWPRSGFVEMVPPMRLPTNQRNDNAIKVWLRIPDGRKITLRRLDDQRRNTLVFPPGTVADRVETMKGEQKAMVLINGIEDVRGATIDDRGRTRFHVYEPVPGGSPDRLRGYEWLRSDNVADDLAADRLISVFYPNAGEAAQAEVRMFRRLNQCGACHQPNRPMPTASSMKTPAPSHLPTDSHGFFQPMTVLEDTMVVRATRPWDLNADDPFVSVWCGTEQTRAVTDGDRRGYKCADGGPAIGKLDMAAALAKNDAHALAVCASRRYLYQHMDDDAKGAYRPFFAECAIK